MPNSTGACALRRISSKSSRVWPEAKILGHVDFGVAEETLNFGIILVHLAGSGLLTVHGTDTEALGQLTPGTELLFPQRQHGDAHRDALTGEDVGRGQRTFQPGLGNFIVLTDGYGAHVAQLGDDPVPVDFGDKGEPAPSPEKWP